MTSADMWNFVGIGIIITLIIFIPLWIYDELQKLKDLRKSEGTK